MRILCIIDYLGAGGSQRQLVGLAAFLKEKGYDVVVAFYHHHSFFLGELQERGVPYDYLKKAENKYTRVFHVARYIRDIKPDVVISYLETPSICCSIARVFNNRFRLIVSERNTTQKTGLNELIRFNLYRWAGFVIPNAFAQEEYIRRAFPFLSDKVVTIPNFVDLDHFVPPVSRVRREVPEVMIAASIWPSKNTLGFIDAFVMLKDKGYRFHISWYGLNQENKGYCDQCQDKIDQLGIGDCFELKEKTARIKECYQSADFFCLPSFYEGTPNVICEAMACGLPVVCSDVCDNGLYVKEGENGFLFNPQSIESMADSLSRMLSVCNEEYANLCSNSRRLAEELFSADTFVGQYLKLINSPS